MKNNLKQAKKALSVKHRRFPLYIILTIILFGGGFLFFRHQQGQVEVLEGLASENIEKIELEQKILAMVEGYPIEEMVPYIIEKDTATAAFLVSIAKKESNWGKRSPKYQGQDCYNYWGYRGPNRIGSGGHSCFNNPKEAVDIVGERIEYLVNEARLDTPAKMIVWKCGSSCSTHSRYSVRKWISDVNIYYEKLSTALFKK